MKNPVTPGDGDPRHGKYSTYTNHKCRCDLCRTAWSEKHRVYMKNSPEQQHKHRQRTRQSRAPHTHPHTLTHDLPPKTPPTPHTAPQTHFTPTHPTQPEFRHTDDLSGTG